LAERNLKSAEEARETALDRLNRSRSDHRAFTVGLRSTNEALMQALGSAQADIAAVKEALNTYGDQFTTTTPDGCVEELIDVVARLKKENSRLRTGVEIHLTSLIRFAESNGMEVSRED
jgi:hypothetical protein